MKIPVPTTKHSKFKRVMVTIYKLIYRRPHQYLIDHSPAYHRWQNFRFRRHVHIAITAFGSLAVVLIIVGSFSHGNR